MKTAKENVRYLRNHRPVELSDISSVCSLMSNEIITSQKTYREVAEKTGLCPATIGRIGEGYTKSPKVNTALVLLKFFGYRVFADRTIAEDKPAMHAL